MVLSANNEALADELHQIVALMIGRDLREDKWSPSWNGFPFDIAPENFHRNKRDFVEELSFVRDWLSQFERFQAFLRQDAGVGTDEDDMHDLAEYLNGWARSDSKYEEPQTAQELAVSNVMRVGIVPSFLLLNEKFKTLLESRLKLLERQEKDYWSVDHRPPNYHARTIAHRVAKVFVKETQKWPTMGTSGITGKPSTDYARALKSVFQALALTADFRAAGDWAISQLKEDDLKPSKAVRPMQVLKQLSESGYLKSINMKGLFDE